MTQKSWCGRESIFLWVYYLLKTKFIYVSVCKSQSSYFGSKTLRLSLWIVMTYMIIQRFSFKKIVLVTILLIFSQTTNLDLGNSNVNTARLSVTETKYILVPLNCIPLAKAPNSSSAPWIPQIQVGTSIWKR